MYGCKRHVTQPSQSSHKTRELLAAQMLTLSPGVVLLEEATAQPTANAVARRLAYEAETQGFETLAEALNELNLQLRPTGSESELTRIVLSFCPLSPVVECPCRFQGTPATAWCLRPLDRAASSTRVPAHRRKQGRLRTSCGSKSTTS